MCFVPQQKAVISNGLTAFGGAVSPYPVYAIPIATVAADTLGTLAGYNNVNRHTFRKATPYAVRLGIGFSVFTFVVSTLGYCFP